MDNRIFLLMGGGGSPQPTPSTHAVPLDFPIKIEFMGGSQVNITGPGTYTGTCGNGAINYSMVVSADKSCTISYEIPGEAPQTPAIIWGFTETPTSTGKFLKDKRYRFSFDKHMLDGLYGGVAIFEIPVNVTGGEQSTDYYAYEYYKEGLTEAEQCSDLSQLAEGGYCEINPDGELGEENMFGIYVLDSEYEPVTSGSFSFAFAFDENTDPVLIQKSINTNGIYFASDDNADGFSAVNVNTPQATFSPAVTDAKCFAVPNAAAVKFLTDNIASNTVTLNSFENLFNNADLRTASNLNNIILTSSNSSVSASNMFKAAMLGNYFPTINVPVNNAENMFNSLYGNDLPEGFTIYMDGTNEISLSNCFKMSKNITKYPLFRKINSGNQIKIKSINWIFSDCVHIRNANNLFNVSELSLERASSTGDCSYAFYDCYSLRVVPEWFKHIVKYNTKPGSSSQAFYYMCFYNCDTLDEATNIPVINFVNMNNNMFSSTFSCCGRLSNITFETNNGTPYTANWKNQTIDLASWTGVINNEGHILNYNSGITINKKVTSQYTYQELKNDPDWYTIDMNYSRYNHDSAVATINSLPDCSAYATGAEVNTIKFKGASGTNTDGGAISNLTAEEIAVATAKGWTVSIV